MGFGMAKFNTNYATGIPKDLCVIIEGRGIDTKTMNGDQMHEILGSHDDFKNEKSLIERYLGEKKKHIVYFLPKFHPEFNPIERVWAQNINIQELIANTVCPPCKRSSVQL